MVTVDDQRWQTLPSEAPDLFDRLRAAGPAEVYVRFGIGVGKGFAVDVPAASLTLQGRLQVEHQVDRFGVQVPGWGPDDFAWLARRKGRGRTDYWQGAIEYHPEGRPALVLYFTAPLDGLEIRLRTL
jgi:hypothetical protein